MQAQDAPDVFLLKLWPWFEKNAKQLFIGTVAILAVVLVYSFISYHHQQSEIAAGQAFTQVIVSAAPNTPPTQIANAFLKVAQDYSGTTAATRAQLQAATMLFEAGQYSDAQAQYQKFVDANPDSPFKAAAMLGSAASLEAAGQKDAALTVYERVAGLSDPATLAPAKFAVARLSEQAGNLQAALTDYAEVASISAGTEFGYEAGIRESELRAKLPAAKPALSATTNAMSLLKP